MKSKTEPIKSKTSKIWIRLKSCYTEKLFICSLIFEFFIYHLTCFQSFPKMYLMLKTFVIKYIDLKYLIFYFFKYLNFGEECLSPKWLAWI